MGLLRRRKNNTEYLLCTSTLLEPFCMCACVLSQFSNVLTLCDPMDIGDIQAPLSMETTGKNLEWIAMPSSGNLPDPGIQRLLCFLHWQAGLTTNTTREAQNSFICVTSINLENMPVNYFSCFVNGNKFSEDE